jgi:hypothetical protein
MRRARSFCSRGGGLSGRFQSLQGFSNVLLGILGFPQHVGLGQRIPPAWDIRTVDVKGDKTPDLQFLIPDTVLVRVLVESVGDELDNEFLASNDQRGEEETEEEVGDQ